MYVVECLMDLLSPPTPSLPSHSFHLLPLLPSPPTPSIPSHSFPPLPSPSFPPLPSPSFPPLPFPPLPSLSFPPLPSPLLAQLPMAYFSGVIERCQPLGDYSPWGTPFDLSQKNKSVVMVTSKVRIVTE